MSTPLLYKLLHDKSSPMEIREPLPWFLVDLAARTPLAVAKEEPPIEELYPRCIPKGGKCVPNPWCVFIGYTDYGTPFCWDFTKPMNPLMLVLGKPGAGKSSLVKTIIHSMICNFKSWCKLTGAPTPPILILDPEGEYHVLKYCPCVEPDEVFEYIIPERDRLNLFDRPSKFMEPLSWYLRIGSMIYPFIVQQSPAQSPLAYIVWKEVIREVTKEKNLDVKDPSVWAKTPDITLGDIIEYVKNKYESLMRGERLDPREKRKRQGYETLYARLSDWEHPPGTAFTGESTVPLAEALKHYKVIILRVRGLPQHMFDMFAWWVATWIYAMMLQRGPAARFRPRIVVVLDEAWILLKARTKGQRSPLEELARRARKYGIVLLVATQTVEEVSKAMFSLFGTVVVGRIDSVEQVERISKSLNWPPLITRRIHSLSTGQMIWTISWKKADFPFSTVPLVVTSIYPVPEDLIVVQE